MTNDVLSKVGVAISLVLIFVGGFIISGIRDITETLERIAKALEEEGQ